MPSPIHVRSSVPVQLLVLLAASSCTSTNAVESRRPSSAQREVVAPELDASREHPRDTVIVAPREESLDAGLKRMQAALQNDDVQALAAAVDALVAEHANSPRLGELTFQLANISLGYPVDPSFATVAEYGFQAIHKCSADPVTRANALHALAMCLGAGSSTDLARRAQAAAAYAQLRDDFGELAAPFSFRWKWNYAEVAEAGLYELSHLQIGMKAPEFRLPDPEGVEFALADYAGQVVLLDFWGFV